MSMKDAAARIAERFKPDIQPPTGRNIRLVESSKLEIADAILPENDLEFLAKTIAMMRSRKEATSADRARAISADEDADTDLNGAIDAYEAEVQRRGLLCRK